MRLRAVDTFRYWPAFEISFGAGFRCPFAAIGVLELMPPLAALCPPAAVIDKTRYSGFAEPKLLAHLREREADALIISGSETDVCVLATVLSAVDLGYGRHLPSPRHPDAARSCCEGTNGTRGARAGDARVWELVQS